MPIEALADVHDLPSLNACERDALDYQLLGMSTRPHPMRHFRSRLDRQGILRIADLDHIPDGRLVRVAGRLISAQRPHTGLAADLRHILRDAHYLVAIGRLERVRWYGSL